MSYLSLHHGFFYKSRLSHLSAILGIGIASLGLAACSDSGQDRFIDRSHFPISILNELSRVEGGEIELTGKTLLVNFWATWCRPCREEMPDLERLSNNLDAERFAVIGVSVDEDRNLIKEFLREYRISFPNYQDDRQILVSSLLNIKAFPVTFLVSPEGVILKTIVGKQLWEVETLETFLSSSQRIQKKPIVAMSFG